MPTADEVDDAIDRWHDDPARAGTHLYQALGWTPEEYGAFVMDPNAIPDRPLPPPSR